MEMTIIILKKSFLAIVLSLVCFSAGIRLSAQEITYNYFYRVYFKDKGVSYPNNFSPEDLLSQRAISRRQKAGISVPVISDLPVNPDYLNQVRSKGFYLHCTSKWMNTGLFKTQNLADINLILSLTFVKDVKIVKKPVGKSSYSDKLNFSMQITDLPPFDMPLTMLNGQSLHNSGYDGSGILIAVLDGGFYKADLIPSLNTLRARGGIRGTRDFVSRSEYVYDYHNHGTAVLSVLAGKITGIIEGTAPGADFWLLRTEDVSTEYPVEEDFWAAGAEFADSIGADIISSSLGYCSFDDPTMDYKFSDMNGNTAFVTQAADFAASKGILVVNSAGNERTKPWRRIIAPSDGDNVVAAGAVDGSKIISTFSSAGPSADGRIKPDNATQGVSVTVQTLETSIDRANGTSFSCPVLSGMCACVMQAVPKATNTDIIDALHKNGDKFNTPDSLYGYGIPDMVGVVSMLQDLFITKPENETVIGPNPFTGDLEIVFKKTPGTLRIMVYTSSGQVVVNRVYNAYIDKTLKLSDLQNKQQGVYFITIITSNGIFTHKVIKLNN
jgi:subtilisin family serine protease